MEVIQTKVNEEFYRLIERFLKKKGMKSSGNIGAYKTHLKALIKFAYNDTPLDIQDITRETIEDYIFYISEKNYKFKYLETKFNCLRSFFKTVKDHFESKNTFYYLPVPLFSDMPFTPDIENSPEQQKQNVEKVYTYDQLVEILEKSSQIYIRKFAAIVLMTWTGARVGEILTIERKNVRLEERLIFTGIHDGARKSNQGRGIYYAIPKEVVIFLRNYMGYLDKRFKGSKYLFPSIHEGKIMSQRGIQKFLEKTFDFKAKCHKFRHTINEYRRVIEEQFTPSEIMSMLLNHKVDRLVVSTYGDLTKNPQKRVEYYDRFMPTEYKKLLKVLLRLI
jgi:site-specific recombinase XerD